MPNAEIAWSVTTLLLGFVVGKFISLASLRMPVGRAVEWSNGGCEACSRRLNLTDLLPVLGYAIRRGRCPSCGVRMPVRHLLIETTCVAIAVWAMVIFPGPFGLISAVLGWWLLLIAILDAEHFWLPDCLTIPLAIFGLIAVAAYRPQQLLDHVIGAAAGFLFLTVVTALYRRVRGRQGMGGGDPRLLAAAGAWVGWTGLASVVLWGSAAALSVVAAKAILHRPLHAQDRVPFGTYLALGIWLTWLYGPIGL